MKSTWRFVLKIGFWDKLAEEAVAAKDAVCGKRRCCPEFDDYDDDLLCE